DPAASTLATSAGTCWRSSAEPSGARVTADGTRPGRELPRMPVLELESRGRSRPTDPAAETGPVGTPTLPSERSPSQPAPASGGLRGAGCVCACMPWAREVDRDTFSLSVRTHAPARATGKAGVKGKRLAPA